MDIRCPKCAEPWDMDCLHEEVRARFPDEKPWLVNGEHNQALYEVEYRKVSAQFRATGCEALVEAFGATHNEDTLGSGRAAVAGALFELLGDDMDGSAAMFEDFDALGTDL